MHDAAAGRSRCGGGMQMALVECELAQLIMTETHDSQTVVLKEKEGRRAIRIGIGLWEIFAIHRTINNEPPPRPMTHELFGQVLRALGVRIVRIVVSELRGHVYIGRLVLEQDGKMFDIDSRPSDAIALAVQQGAPIFVDEQVLEVAGEEL